MPGRKKGGSTGAKDKQTGAKNPSKSAGQPRDKTADVYRDMVNEDNAVSSIEHESLRPLKRRKLRPTDEADSTSTSPQPEPVSQDLEGLSSSPGSTSRPAQVVYNGSDDSAEDSDFEFEDVNLAGDEGSQPDVKEETADQGLSIELDPKKDLPARAAQKRLPSSRLEKQKRLEIHKVHLQCLLAHVYIRNDWCNDPVIQASLRGTINKRIANMLKKPSSASQWDRSHSFVEGLKKASEVFRQSYRITARGMSRPEWGTANKGKRLNQLEDPMTKEDFKLAAQNREGSRDTGAQLFCALLRSVGIDARLACSLQPLPLTSAAPTQPQPADAHKCTINEEDLSSERSHQPTPTPRKAPSPAPSSPGPTPIKRFGASTSHYPTTPNRDLGTAPTPPPRKLPITESSYPTSWTEAFSPALQKWLPIDPLTTLTVGKPRALEPPLSDALNTLSYVVAFEDDGAVKDVTRRYAKAYNAKTRRGRVDATSLGGKWWNRCLKWFHGNLASTRDEIEDAELAALEAAEPMPRSIGDFRDHPVYALERHLRRNEAVVQGGRRVGTVTVGKGGVEDVFRRGDVRVCKSGDGWYSVGREVREGEQALKVVLPGKRGRRERSRSREVGDEYDVGQESGMSLYAVHQTKPFVPPPVEDGRVPRNAFGNLDVYVPSMIPPGGAHVRAREAVHVAKILRIDYADAVTGFTFKGQRGTAVTQGVIVAREYADAMEETVKALRYARESEEQHRVRTRILGLWKRFLVGLKVLERVNEHFDDDHEEHDVDMVKEVDEAEKKELFEQGQGGFMQDVDDSVVEVAPTHQSGAGAPEDGATASINDVDGWKAQQELQNANLEQEGPICIFSPWDRGKPAASFEDIGQKSTANTGDKVDDLFGESERGGGFMPEDSPGSSDNTDGGGFIPSQMDVDNPVGGGGFIPEREHGQDIGDRGFLLENDQAPASAVAPPKATPENAWLSQEKTPREQQASSPSGDQDDSDTLMSGALLIPGDSSAQEVTSSSQHQLHQLNAAISKVDQAPTLRETMTPSNAEGEGITHDVAPMPNNNSPHNDSNDRSPQQHEEASEGETGSLLSHDPEDEDMEPEWL